MIRLLYTFENFNVINCHCNALLKQNKFSKIIHNIVVYITPVIFQSPSRIKKMSRSRFTSMSSSASIEGGSSSKLLLLQKLEIGLLFVFLPLINCNIQHSNVLLPCLHYFTQT